MIHLLCQHHPVWELGYYEISFMTSSEIKDSFEFHVSNEFIKIERLCPSLHNLWKYLIAATLSWL